MAVSRATLNKKGKPRKTAEEAAAKRAAKGKVTAKTGAKKVKQPDDPGTEKLLGEVEATWAATPEWVKAALVILVLVAIVGFLF